MSNTIHLLNNFKFSERFGFWIIGLISFALAFVLAWPLFTSLSAEERVQEKFEDKIETQQKDLAQFKVQLAVYSNPFEIVHNTIFRKQVHIHDRLVYWSDDARFPDFDLEGKMGSYYYKGEIGEGVLLLDRLGDGNEVTIISYYPVKVNYPFENQYLKNGLNHDLFGEYNASLSTKTSKSLRYRGDDVVFYDLKRGATSQNTELILILSLLLAFFIYVQLLGWKISRHKIVVVLVLFLIRIVIHLLVTSIGSLAIFEPINYTSPVFGKSAGALLLNVLLVFSLAFTLRNDLDKVFRQFSAKVRALLSGTLLTLLFSLYAALILDIFRNSLVNLDITNSLEFDQVKVVLTIIIVMAGASLILLSRLLLNLVDYHLKKWILAIFILISMTGWFLFENLSLFVLPLFLVSILLCYLNYNTLEVKLDFRFFTSIILLTVGIAGTTATIIYKQAELDDLVQKQKFANSLLLQNDFNAEILLNKVLPEIAKDDFIRSRFLSNRLSGDLIKNKVRNEYLSPYFNKYAMDVYLLDNDKQLVYGTYDGNVLLFDSLENNKTAFTNLYLFVGKRPEITDKYIARVPFQSLGGDLGQLMMVFSLKKYIPKSVYPQLLSSESYGSNVNYDYGVFKNQKLLYKRGKHPFENELATNDFNNENLDEKNIEKGKTAYYGIRTSDERLIVIASSLYSTQKILQNASFYFALFLAFWLVILLIHISVNKLRLSLTAKIQISLSISIFIPMIIVAIALLTSLSKSYKSEIDRNFSKRSFSMAENLIDVTDDFLLGRLNKTQFANRIVSNSELTQSDLNIYDLSGKLIVSSQPQIFNQSLLSGLIEPEALNALRYGNEQSIILDRKIGESEFKTSYTAIKSYRDGKLLAILAMPYFDSKNHLRKQQIEVFNNVALIFSVIFLIAYFAENIFVGRLIAPLRKIADKLSRTKLEETNEPLEYNADDEIGQLVGEYNSMLNKLESSKQALADSQKESAWKEIARQVAHEIKNPLTPMRLRIQQLMRSVKDNEDQYRVLHSLIDQIDSLSSIADSFSAFATMPAPNNSVFEVKEVILSAVEVYKNDRTEIAVELVDEPTHVFTDPKLFSRVLSNILLNGIQSVEENTPVIHLNLQIKDKFVLLEITDNGKGMGEDVQRNIFKPYFSTKTTGSGIGLAVAKKGIENAGGSIWFESAEGKGSTFYIKLPKH